MSFDIHIERKTKNQFDLVSDLKVLGLKRKVKDVLNDISDELAVSASIHAPISDPDDKEGGSASHIPSGALKIHAVQQTRSQFGIAEPAAPLFGGGFAVRGAGGRFVPGKASTSDFGHIFYTVTTTYPDTPYYARYVAFGTGIYGPRNTPIVSISGKPMKFRYKEKNWKLKTVLGQRPQPYLDTATDEVNSYFIPMKMRELRARL